MTIEQLHRLSRGHVLAVRDPRAGGDSPRGVSRCQAFFEGMTQRRDGRDAVRVRLQWFGPDHHDNDGFVRSTTLLDPKEVVC